jgi:sulfatase maturation enzyme AslB (radical SAM superfamily)
MPTGLLSSGIVHLHATRQCNLACLHCYSASSPAERSSLPLDALLATLALLRRHGYETLSLSGGEPLLYPDLRPLVREARRIGYRVSLISNGYPLTSGRFDDLLPDFSAIAISLDGAPETHDRLRGQAGAFARAEAAMTRLANLGHPFGIAFCVGRSALGDLPWALEFAAAKGAGLLQIHPMAATGRAASACPDELLTSNDKARLYLTTELLRSGAPDDLFVQLDLTTAAGLLTQQSAFARLTASSATPQTRLASVVNPLVIDETGALLPFAYGMPQPYQISNSTDPDSLEQAICTYLGAGIAPLARLVQRYFTELAQEPEAFVDWYAGLVQQASAEPSPR